MEIETRLIAMLPIIGQQKLCCGSTPIWQNKPSGHIGFLEAHPCKELFVNGWVQGL